MTYIVCLHEQTYCCALLRILHFYSYWPEIIQDVMKTLLIAPRKTLVLCIKGEFHLAGGRGMIEKHWLQIYS